MLTPHASKNPHLERCLFASLLLLAGCTHWHTQEVSPVRLLTSSAPTRIRITRGDESRIVLHNPQLVGDTIMDVRPGHAPKKVAVNDVAQVAVRKWDPLATGGLVLGTAALGAVVAIGAIWDSRAD